MRNEIYRAANDVTRSMVYRWSLAAQCNVSNGGRLKFGFKTLNHTVQYLSSQGSSVGGDRLLLREHWVGNEKRPVVDDVVSYKMPLRCDRTEYWVP